MHGCPVHMLSYYTVCSTYICSFVRKAFPFQSHLVSFWCINLSLENWREGRCVRLFSCEYSLSHLIYLPSSIHNVVVLESEPFLFFTCLNNCFLCLNLCQVPPSLSVHCSMITPWRNSRGKRLKGYFVIKFFVPRRELAVVSGEGVTLAEPGPQLVPDDVTVFLLRGHFRCE